MPDDQLRDPYLGHDEAASPPAKPKRRRGRIVVTGLAVVGALAIGLVVLQALTGWADTDEQKAYDAGVEWAQGEVVDVCAFLREGKVAMDELLAAGDSVTANSLAAGMVNNANQAMSKEAVAAGYGAEDAFFISGAWDTFTEACPDAFFDPEIAGRPPG